MDQRAKHLPGRCSALLDRHIDAVEGDGVRAGEWGHSPSKHPVQSLTTSTLNTLFMEITKQMMQMYSGTPITVTGKKWLEMC